MTSEESQYEGDLVPKWSPNYMRQAAAAQKMQSQLFRSLAQTLHDQPPGKYNITFIGDEIVVNENPDFPGNPPFIKEEDMNPRRTRILRRSAKEQALRKKYKVRDCCDTVRNSRGHLEDCELYSGIPATEKITVGGDPEGMSFANTMSPTGRMWMAEPPLQTTKQGEPKMSTRKQLKAQLDAMRQQLTELAEIQAKYSVLPEEDTYPVDTIGRFVLRIKVKEPKDGPKVKLYGDAQYDASNYHMVDKDLTFLILKAQDELWYTTGSNFFCGQRTGLSWEDLCDKILDNDAELINFEFLNQGKETWDVLYTK